MAVRSGVLKAAVGIIAFCLAAYIVGPPLYWHLVEQGLAAFSPSSSSSCPSCICDCVDPLQLLSVPQDCAKHDPEESLDTQKNFVELLSEELKLRGAEASKKHHQADTALLEAKKMTSQYQKEADKCNSGMETCEEAREKAEAALLAQKQLTAKWVLRASQRGWKEGLINH
ncbi:hypothetical protein F511_07575 [Dorcoceras hygrometricum]|uniref:Uncharacterized protein n=1 Tax=Dorcoceras hygrometricum TaxID=472368 RepID=A0A2Z7D8U5_9LAMI|nr:hypothetical protein F511_07575 [Dorcoceras hygrometricum]